LHPSTCLKDLFIGFSYPDLGMPGQLAREVAEYGVFQETDQFSHH
jgi:hypothetical protein